jgi:nucleoside-diphosphate-sugar epimerase
VTLVTGATGFVGSALCQALARKGLRVRGAVRNAERISPSDAATPEIIAVGDIGPATEWQAAMSNVDRVVHLVARTHVLRETGADTLADYRSVNVEGTKRLAQTAARSGVKRFVFVSSIKVNGESTGDYPFTEKDTPRPEDAYGISKWEAEQALWQIAAESGMRAVVLRPPLVYGPGVKGNLLQLLRLVARGWPLPLASIRNRRSLVFVGNLVDAIMAAASSPAAPGNTYLVSDGEDVSTPDLVRALAGALNVPARLVPCPAVLLKFAARLIGRSDAAARLTGSLQVDSSNIRSQLGWRPHVTLAAGLAETARWYHA